jgi:hypothetical protein
MGIRLLALAFQIVIHCDTYPHLVFCKAIFLKVVKVVYFYKLVYVLILKDFGWAIPFHYHRFVHRFTPGRGKPRPYKSSGSMVGLT